MARKRKKIKNIEKGYICTCGKEHKYSMYVYAHTHDTLIHTCECGHKVRVYDCRAYEIAEDENG